MEFFRSSVSKGSAGALGLLLLGAATGAIRVPGFAGQNDTPAPKPPVKECVDPPAPSPQPFGPGVLVPPAPSPAPVSKLPAIAPITPPKATIASGALNALATLGQAKVVRGENGELFLHVAIDATNDVPQTARRPIDLALVLDVSGSMNDRLGSDARGSKIDLLRQACRGIIDRLKDDDRITVVTFSNEATVVFPLQTIGANRDAFRRAIEQLQANGGTNLGSGLLAGSDELRKVDPRAGAARRMILMTDGLANIGIVAPNELNDLVRGLSREGSTISTVGLGLEYNETLLSGLAESGGGLYHYASEAERLATIYKAEVEETRGLVARDVRVVISPVGASAIDSVFLYPTTRRADGSIEVSLGDMSAGRRAKIVAKLKVPTGATVPAAIDVAHVGLRFQDVRGEKPLAVAPAEVALGVELVNDASVAMSSKAPEIQKELQEVVLAVTIEKAQHAAYDGKGEEAKKMIRDAEKSLGVRRLEFYRADKTKTEVDLDQLAEGLRERGRVQCSPGMASEAGEKAAKLAGDCQRAAR